jgi:hypothetical protein
MDVVVPFYDLIGLHVPDDLAFRNLFRNVILEARKEFPEVDPGKVLVRSERLLGVVSRIFGAASSAELEEWGNYIFQFSVEDQRQILRQWMLVIRHALRTPEVWKTLEIPEAHSAEFKKRYLISVDTDEYESRERSIRLRPLSDWDLHQYALCLYNDEEPEPINGPSSYIYPTTQVYQGMVFWSWVFKTLSAEDLGRLQNRALDAAKTNKSLKFVTELPFPEVKGVSHE